MVITLWSANMLMHILPHYTQAFLSLSVISTYHSLARAKTYKLMLLLPLFSLRLALFACILHAQAIAPNLSMAFCSRGKDAHFFIYNLLYLDAGAASPCCREISGRSCTWLPAKESLELRTQAEEKLHNTSKKICLSHRFVKAL